MLCEWRSKAKAAPHIKTYVRYAEKLPSKAAGVVWALLTSANLSTQAWGGGEAVAKGKGKGKVEVRICSYEAGVLVYPELFKDVAGKVEGGQG